MGGGEVTRDALIFFLENWRNNQELEDTLHEHAFYSTRQEFAPSGPLMTAWTSLMLLGVVSAESRINHPLATATDLWRKELASGRLV